MLRVWADSRSAGVLGRWRRKGTTFAYDPLADPEQAVSLTMPKRIESWDVAFGLPPIFDMNLPEGSLRDLLRRRFAKALGTFDDLDLLSVVGRSQIGRIRYSALKEPLSEDVPFQSIDEILHARRDGGLFNYLLDRFAVYSGLAGVQPKVMIRGIGEEKLEGGTSNLKGATHIVKFWDEAEYPELAANEYFCLQAARRAGLSVPNFSLSDSGQALVIDRFDLIDGRYIGFEDFCVLNGVTSALKYKGGYEAKLFKRMVSYITPERLHGDLELAFRLFVLNCTLRNGDAHLKNFGLVYDHVDGEVGLAPAYDLVTTCAYIESDQMALTLNGSTRWPERDALISLGQSRANLPPRRSSQIIDEVCEAVVDVGADLYSYFRESPHPEIGERMLAHWNGGLQSLSDGKTYISTSTWQSPSP